LRTEDDQYDATYLIYANVPLLVSLTDSSLYRRTLVCVVTSVLGMKHTSVSTY